jgi:hypothetical protein
MTARITANSHLGHWIQASKNGNVIVHTIYHWGKITRTTYTVSTEHLHHYTRSRHGLFQVPYIILNTRNEYDEKRHWWNGFLSNTVKFLYPRNKMWYRFHKRRVNSTTPSATQDHSLKSQDDRWTAKMKVFGDKRLRFHWGNVGYSELWLRYW